MDNAIREFSLAKPSWYMSHYTMIYKNGERMRDFLGRWSEIFGKSACLYNKKNITRRLEDMNFIFSLAALVRKILFCHSKIKFISSRHRVISSIYSQLLKTGSLDNAIREFSLAKPSWYMSHYTMIYKNGERMRDFLGLFAFIVA